MRRAVDYLSLIIIASIIWASPSLANDSPFNCHVTTENYEFDLTPLAGEHTINRTRDTPPSEMIDSLRFNLCKDLEIAENVPQKDQCSSDTRACLTVVNKKEGVEDRVVSVIPIIRTSKLKASYSVIQDPQSLSISFSGSEYPHPSNSTLVNQFMDLALVCNREATDAPKFVSYDGTRLVVEWTTPVGCYSLKDKPTGDKPGDDGNEQAPRDNVGSGIGWFFLMLILALLAYFALGAYYNYSTYGARGLDLIPHRDFWQEVPYMLRDVVSHLCSDVGARRTSRSGYIAV